MSPIVLLVGGGLVLVGFILGFVIGVIICMIRVDEEEVR